MSGGLFPEPQPQSGIGVEAAIGLAAAGQTPLGDFLAASAEEGWWSTLAGQARAQLRRQAADDAGAVAGLVPLDEEAWRASPHFRQGLTFRPGATERGARVDAEIHDEQKVREMLIGARGGGAGNFLLGLGAGVVGSIPTPENFIPFAGPAIRAAEAGRFGAMMVRAARSVQAARAGGLGARAAAGAGMGAVDGLLGSLAVMPLTIPSRESFGDDVTFADILLDLAFGAAAGGVIGGAAGAAFGRAAPNAPALPPGTVPDAAAGLPGITPSPEQTDAVLRAMAVAADQMARGQGINLSLLPPEVRAHIETTQAEGHGAEAD
jgi:hypothetical protein